MFQCLKLHCTVPVSCFWNLEQQSLKHWIIWFSIVWNWSSSRLGQLTGAAPWIRDVFLYSVFVPLDSRQWQRAVFTYSWRIVQTCVNYWATTLHTSAQYCDYMMNMCLFYSLCPVVEMNFPIPNTSKLT